jgi:hypothetical protein
MFGPHAHPGSRWVSARSTARFTSVAGVDVVDVVNAQPHPLPARLLSSLGVRDLSGGPETFSTFTASTGLAKGVGGSALFPLFGPPRRR